MNTSFKIAIAGVVGCLVGSMALPVAQAVWVTGAAPEICNMEDIAGRGDKTMTAPPGFGQAGTNITLNDEYEIGWRLAGQGGTNGRGWSVFNTRNGGALLGTGMNPTEYIQRLAGATFNNVLKMECRLRFMTYQLGFSQGQRINDAAAYDRNTRNHSLYQRTNDLEEAINALRIEIRNGRIGTTTDTTVNTNVAPMATSQPSIAPLPANFNFGGSTNGLFNFQQTQPLFVDTGAAVTQPQSQPQPTPLQEIVSPGVSNQACLNTCDAQKITCIKRAVTGKAMQQCEADEDTCAAACR